MYVRSVRSQAQDCGISIDYASIAHPPSNGQVEWANGLLLARLKPRLFDELKDYGGKWIYELPKVVWGLHTQQSKATRYSPFFLVYGSEAILPMNLIQNSPRVEQYNEGEADETRGQKLIVPKKSSLTHSFNLLGTCKAYDVTMTKTCAPVPFKSEIQSSSVSRIPRDNKNYSAPGKAPLSSPKLIGQAPSS